MYFPTMSQMIASQGFFLLTGPFALLVSIMMWRQVLQDRRKTPSGPIDATLLFGSLIMTLIGIAHTGPMISSFWAAQQWSLDINNVQEVRIRYRADEYSAPSGAPIVVRDQHQIREGLLHLNSATPFQRNREHFENGYMIEIVLQSGGKEQIRTLSVYKNSSNSYTASHAIVIPSSSSSPIGGGFGLFDAPAFARWIQEVVVQVPESAL